MGVNAETPVSRTRQIRVAWAGLKCDVIRDAVKGRGSKTLLRYARSICDVSQGI